METRVRPVLEIIEEMAQVSQRWGIVMDTLMDSPPGPQTPPGAIPL